MLRAGQAVAEVKSLYSESSPADEFWRVGASIPRRSIWDAASGTELHVLGEVDLGGLDEGSGPGGASFNFSSADAMNGKEETISAVVQSGWRLRRNRIVAGNGQDLGHRDRQGVAFLERGSPRRSGPSNTARTDRGCCWFTPTIRRWSSHAMRLRFGGQAMAKSLPAGADSPPESARAVQPHRPRGADRPRQ